MVVAVRLSTFGVFFVSTSALADGDVHVQWQVAEYRDAGAQVMWLGIGCAKPMYVWYDT